MNQSNRYCHFIHRYLLREEKLFRSTEPTIYYMINMRKRCLEKRDQTSSNASTVATCLTVEKGNC